MYIYTLFFYHENSNLEYKQFLLALNFVNGPKMHFKFLLYRNRLTVIDVCKILVHKKLVYSIIPTVRLFLSSPALCYYLVNKPM